MSRCGRLVSVAYDASRQTALPGLHDGCFVEPAWSVSEIEGLSLRLQRDSRIPTRGLCAVSTASHPWKERTRQWRHNLFHTAANVRRWRLGPGYDI